MELLLAQTIALRVAKSTADFIARMKIVEEEADECDYWLVLLIQAGYISSESAALLQQEANELVAIVVSSIQTAQRNMPTKK